MAPMLRTLDEPAREGLVPQAGAVHGRVVPQLLARARVEDRDGIAHRRVAVAAVRQRDGGRRAESLAEVEDPRVAHPVVARGRGARRGQAEGHRRVVVLLRG